MPNMSYCRFENTYHDLKDCLNALDDAGGVKQVMEDTNQYEKPYVRKLISLCQEIAEVYGNDE